MSGAAASVAFEREPIAAVGGEIRRRWSNSEIIAAVANVATACAIVWLFHDRFWWAPDEGIYAYIADRLRTGAVLNRDVQGIHAGYIYFFHAFALDVFGRDLLSLRFPIAALTIAQSAIVFWILRPLLGPAAICGGTAMSALTFVQFLNPSANWYALFFTVVLAALLSARLERRAFGVIAIGFAIATLFLTRQLTGVFVGIGAIAWLLLPERAEDRGRPWLARSIVLIMALGLAAYLWAKADAAALALYGLCPLAALVAVGGRTRLDSGRTLRLAGLLSIGGALAALPLLLYLLRHGTFTVWWQDTVLSAVSLTGIEFFGHTSYATLLVLAIRAALDVAEPVAFLNGTFWLLCLTAPFALGISVLHRLRTDAEKIHPLPFLAMFHALVAVILAIPIYAMIPLGLTLAGLLSLARRPLPRVLGGVATAFAIAIGLMFHAAQPLSRGFDGIARGERVSLDAGGLPGASLRMEQSDHVLYTRLLDFIRSHAASDQTILSLPVSPEFYFLSERKPPVRFVIAAIALGSRAEFQRSLDAVRTSPPAIVIFHPADKYTTPQVRTFLDELRPIYRFCGTLGPYELYAQPRCNRVP